MHEKYKIQSFNWVNIAKKLKTDVLSLKKEIYFIIILNNFISIIFSYINNNGIMFMFMFQKIKLHLYFSVN
jgi:hypothetical protein